ncbi:MAG: DMT family transporter [Gammaproteobacteria bacterium]
MSRSHEEKGLAQGPAEWALLFTLVVLWGSAFVLIRISLDAFAPIAVTAGRLIVGAAVLVVILLAARRPVPSTGAAWRFFTAIAVLGNALPFFLISWGQQGVPSGMAGILMAMMPLVVLVLAHFLVPGERLTRRSVAGFLVGFSGVVVLTGPEALTAVAGGQARLWSQLAILGGAVCYGVAAIIARRGPSFHPVVTGACVLSIASAIAVAAALSAFVPSAGPGALMTGQLTPAAALALFCLGAFSTGLATVVFFNLVRRSGPTFISLINYLIPLWAVFLGAAALGERLPVRAFAALALILGGIVLARYRRSASEEAS